jgi:hypothetical protein
LVESIVVVVIVAVVTVIAIDRMLNQGGCPDAVCKARSSAILQATMAKLLNGAMGGRFPTKAEADCISALERASGQVKTGSNNWCGYEQIARDVCKNANVLW